MITLFTTPKDFSGIFDIIQTNALNSWRTISPEIQILVIGNSKGSKEAAESINAEFIPEVECSSEGTPLINSLFSKAESRARYSIMAYINADIILPPNFLETIFLFLKMKSKFLGVGYRWDMDIKDLINFENKATSDLFWENAKNKANKHACTGIDYFIFIKGSLKIISNLSIGKFGWDNWLLWKARRMRIPLIDLSDNLFIIHQNHTYNYGKNRNKNEILNSQDGMMNSLMIGNKTLNLLDCNYKIKNNMVSKNKSKTFTLRNLHRLPCIFPELSIPIKLYRRIYKRLILD